MDEPLPDNGQTDIDMTDVYASDGFNDVWGDNQGQAPIEKHRDLLKDLTNFDPVIKARIRNWLGLEFDEDANDYVQKHPPIINTRGARWAIGFLQTYQTKTNFLTNITQNEFNNLQHDIIKLVWLVFPTNDHFGVKTTADWYRLCTELDNSAFLVLAGAGDGKYTKFLGDSVQRNETVNLSPQNIPQQQQPEQGGFISSLTNKLLGRR